MRLVRFGSDRPIQLPSRSMSVVAPNSRQILQRSEMTQVPCMDDARDAREKSDISAKRSGAAMYSAFEAAALAAGPDVIR